MITEIVPSLLLRTSKLVTAVLLEMVMIELKSTMSQKGRSVGFTSIKIYILFSLSRFSM